MRKFEEIKETPLYWYNKASDLRGSAGSIWYCMKNDSKYNIAKELGFNDEFNLSITGFWVFPMLCGLSLELIYKAICIKNNTGFNNTHNLKSLANLANVVVPDELLPFLKIYTESISWSGKYPIPTDRQKNEYENLNLICKETLTDDVQISENLKIYKGNGEPSWKTFNMLWEIASDTYFNETC